jgi:hypothetical protein
MQRAYLHSTRLFALLTCALGAAMVVATVIRGGGPLALGVIVGAAFVAIGAGRLYLAGHR